MIETINSDAAQAHPSSGWREPATLVLDEKGVIRDCGGECEELFGYGLRTLVAQHVSSLFPQLAGVELLQNGRPNARLAYLCRCGHVFLARDRLGGTIPIELTLVALEHAGKHILRLFLLPAAHAGAELRA